MPEEISSAETSARITQTRFKCDFNVHTKIFSLKLAENLKAIKTLHFPAFGQAKTSVLESLFNLLIWP